ncbi:MAG: hypothetical protein AAE987_07085 [Thermoplasmataceae archaeon]|jgi:hypothetical protein
MIQKSKKLIMFAVIAVIIVAVPVSFYELSDPPNPTITSVHNQISDGVWYLNASASPPSSLFSFNNISSSSTFTSSSLNSSISVALSNVSGCFQPGEGFFAVYIDNFTISGNINGNIRPTSITIMQTEEAQFPSVMKFMFSQGDEQAYNTTKISCWFFTDWNDKFENSTDMYDGSACSNISLLNDSAGQHTLFVSQKNISYKFELANLINIWLYPKHNAYNVTKYYLSLIVSLNGLGKTVQTQINIEIIRGSGP